MYMIGPQTTSDEQSASAQICTRTGYFHSFELNPPAIGLATLKIYDSENSTLAGKKILAEGICAAGQNSIFLSYMTPRVALRGIYASLTTTVGTTTYVAGYSLG